MEGTDMRALLAVLPVGGMTCMSCVETVQQQIGKLPGVHSIKVSLEGGDAAVIYDPALQMPGTLQEAIEEMGFLSAPVDLHPQAVTTDSLTFHLSQDQAAEPTCTELLALPGVVEVRPSEEGAGLSVTFIPSLVSPDVMIQRFPGLIPTKDNPTAQSGDLLVKMRVEGMTCHSCTSTIEGKIGKLNGVQRIKVSLDNKEALIIYHPDLVSPAEIRSQIDKAGFSATIKSKPPSKLGTIDVSRLTNGNGGVSLPRPKLHTDLTRAVFQVDGMHCKSCVLNIESNMAAHPGVSGVDVSLEEKTAVLHYNPNLTNPGALCRAIEALSPRTFKVSLSNGPEYIQPPDTRTQPGPESSKKTNQESPSNVTIINIQGMTCNSCVQSIEGLISQKPGVRSIRVSLGGATGTVEYDPNVTSQEDVRAAIEDMGFDASLGDHGIRPFPVW